MKIVYNSMGIFGKILVIANFAKFRETLEKHKHKKTFEKVRRNFMKIFLELRNYILQICVRIFEEKFKNLKTYRKNFGEL